MESKEIEEKKNNKEPLRCREKKVLFSCAMFWIPNRTQFQAYRSTHTSEGYTKLYDILFFRSILQASQ